MLPVALIAGGLATRLKPLTERIPKSMIEVAGRPFIDWQLRELKCQGVEDVIICAGHLGGQLRSYVGNGGRYGLRIQYSFDGSSQLGTGGALKNAVALLGDYFFVIYGDSLLPIDLPPIENFFFENERSPLMVVIRNKNKWDKSNADFREGLVLDYNKANPSKNMEFIDYGLAALPRELFVKREAETSFDLADLYHDLSKEGKLYGYEVFDRFYEIGSMDGLKQTESYLLERINT